MNDNMKIVSTIKHKNIEIFLKEILNEINFNIVSLFILDRFEKKMSKIMNEDVKKVPQSNSVIANSVITNSRL
jgi:hypothetical protein